MRPTRTSRIPAAGSSLRPPSGPRWRRETPPPGRTNETDLTRNRRSCDGEQVRCGCFLTRRRSDEQIRLVVSLGNSLAGDVEIARLPLDADEAAAHLGTGDAG